MPYKNLIVNVSMKLISAFLTTLTLSLPVYLSGSVIAYIYEIQHPLSKGEDDLGFGLVMVLWLVIALACVAILFLPLYKFIHNKIITYLGGK